MQAQGFVPESSGNLEPGATDDGLLDDLPRGNFMLMIHPLDWQVDQRGKLVPVIVHIGKEVGNGSVSRKGDWTQHLLEHQRNGFVLIPHDFLGADRDYVDVYRNKYRKKVHRTVFETPQVGPDGKTVYSVDMKAVWKFHDLLRLRGIVKQPQVRVVRELLNQRRTLYADKEKRGPRNTTGEAVERYERDMRHLREVMTMLEAELAESVKVYGEDISVVDGRLDELLEQELAAAKASEGATASVRRAVKPRPPRKGIVPEKPSTDPDEDDDE